RLIALDATDRHRPPHLDRPKPNRLSAKEDVDLELPVRRHERVQRTRGVADHANGDVLWAGWDVLQQIAPVGACRDRTAQIRECDDGTWKRLARLAVAHHATDDGLGRLLHL